MRSFAHSIRGYGEDTARLLSHSLAQRNELKKNRARWLKSISILQK